MNTKKHASEFICVFVPVFKRVFTGQKISGLLFKISGSDFKIRATNFFLAPMRGLCTENQFSLFSLRNRHFPVQVLWLGICCYVCFCTVCFLLPRGVRRWGIKPQTVIRELSSNVKCGLFAKLRTSAVICLCVRLRRSPLRLQPGVKLSAGNKHAI